MENRSKGYLFASLNRIAVVADAPAFGFSSVVIQLIRIHITELEISILCLNKLDKKCHNIVRLKLHIYNLTHVLARDLTRKLFY